MNNLIEVYAIMEKNKEKDEKEIECFFSYENTVNFLNKIKEENQNKNYFLEKRFLTKEWVDKNFKKKG